MTDEIKMLPVKLTDYEKDQRASELVEILDEIERREEAEAARKKLEKESIEGLKLKASGLVAILRTGSETRPVMTATHDNTARWTIDYVRLDTGEVYHSRSMTATEREKAAQLGLALQDRLAALEEQVAAAEPKSAAPEGRDASWVETKSEPPAAPEPGRNDTLPEAADVKRPKRGEPKTKADKLVADAAGESDGWKL